MSRESDAHEAATAHLHACQEAAEALEETDHEGLTWESVGGPAINGDWFCACETCEIRELLAAAWPHALAAAADLIAEQLPVLVNAGASAAEKLLRLEAHRVTLPGQTPPDSEPLHDEPEPVDDGQLGPNSGPCPRCEKPVALPLLAGHLDVHDVRGDA